MSSLEFHTKIHKALTCLLKRYDFFKQNYPSSEDIDAWEILHSAPFDLLQKYHISPVYNEKLITVTKERKRNEYWLEFNKYYKAAGNLSVDEINNIPVLELDNRLEKKPSAPGKTLETIIEHDYSVFDEKKVDNENTGTRLPDAAEQVMLGSGITMGIIGQGGMARVYKIYNEELSVFRAVKVITETGGDVGKKLSERMMTEAKIAARIMHPNVVITHAVGKWNDYTYLEMEYVEGTDMANHILAAKRLPPAIACAVGLNICSGLVCAHNKEYSLFGKNFKGIIHRDLKPANVMFSNEGQVKIMDFGIARPIKMGFHTGTGVFTGSLQYAAPEQIDSFGIDQRTDIYSFGTVLYEMLTGKKTFPHSDSKSILRAKLNNTYTPIQDFRIKAPHSLVKVINKCITLDKTDRFETSSDLANALEGAFYRITRERPDAVLQEYVHRRGPRIHAENIFMSGNKNIWKMMFGK